MIELAEADALIALIIYNKVIFHRMVDISFYYIVQSIGFEYSSYDKMLMFRFWYYLIVIIDIILLLVCI